MSLIFLKYWKKKEIFNMFYQGQERASISHKKKPAENKCLKPDESISNSDSKGHKQEFNEDSMLEQMWSPI